ncbi:hypothetical protein A8B73_12580 [Methylosinus sp. 3S-1]|nr:hypothetical protein A8B73_12580 [Methylosinus sp. 3S-1]
MEIEPPKARRISRRAATKVLRAAVDAAADRPALRERLGAALMDEGRHGEAIAALRASAAAEPSGFTSWGRLAQCHLAIGEPAAALDICERAQGRGVARARGGALEALGRPEDALREYARAFAEDDADALALEAALRLLSHASDAEPLLAFCAALPATRRFDAQRLAFRALAYSRLGRTQEARALIDPDRHVMLFRFVPPAALGAVDLFNRRLAAFLLANMGQTPTPRPDCVIDGGLPQRRDPLLLALREFFRRSFDGYIAAMPALGLHGPAPAAGRIEEVVVFLRGAGRNGEHVHPGGYVSGVYYVEAPSSVLAGSDLRGRLALGQCERLTGGHRPAWSVRHVAPEPGTLVVFPSHMFHDVVPTRSEALRIAIGLDVRPCGEESEEPT